MHLHSPDCTKEAREDKQRRRLKKAKQQHTLNKYQQ